MVLFSEGFESPPNTPPNTFANWTIGAGTPTMQNTTVHSGTYALQAPTTDDSYLYRSLSGGAIPDLFIRSYIRLDVFPVNNYSMFMEVADNGFTYDIRCGLATGPGAVTKYWTLLCNANYYNTVATISLNTWYCMEMEVQNGGTCNLWIDGNLIKNTTGEAIANDPLRTNIGSVYSATDAGINNYIDDLVIDSAYIGPMAPEIPFLGTVLTCLWKP